MEHRWGERWKIELAVRVRPVEASAGLDQHRSVMGRLSDISLSGARVESSETVPLFAHVRIEPVWPASHVSCSAARRRRWVLEGHVVRTDARGFGLEWHEFGSPALRRLLSVGLRLTPGQALPAPARQDAPCSPLAAGASARVQRQEGPCSSATLRIARRNSTDASQRCVV